jgi:pimeloyl-ACP methyl ester carboxylesterase
VLTRPNIDASISLPDGRDVAYADFGPADGRPVVYFHGHPGCRLDFGREDLRGVLKDAGFRLIGFDRPGFGGTRFVPGRTHLDCAGDVEQIADQLGLERFSVLGYSRGGLFALACATLFPDRLDGVCLLSAGANREMPEFRRAWRRDLRALMSLGRHAPGLARALTRANIRQMERNGRAAAKGYSRSLRSPADDVVIDGVVRENPDSYIHLARECNRQGPAAFIEDFRRLFDWPLDFRLTDVSTQVALWHGGADNLVPISHGRYMAAALPNARLEEVPNHGHLPTSSVLSSIARRLKSTV